MKRLFSTGWVFVLVILMATGAFADRKAAPNADCDDCLKTSPDRNLNWNAETVESSSLRDEEAVYHDGSFEGEIGCGGGCGFSVRFTADTPIFLTGVRIYTQSGNATAAVVSIYTDPAGAIAGPPTAPVGPNDPSAIWESDPMDLTSGADPTQFDIAIDNLTIPAGDYYVVVWENESGTAFISNDLQLNYIDRNWGYSSVGWSTINDATGGAPDLTGNLGISTFFLPQQIEGSYMTVDPRNINFGVLQIDDGMVTQDITIGNIGLESFDVTAIDIAGVGFTTDLITPVTVLPDTFITMDITYTPTVEGPITGTFTITSDADNSTEAIINASAMVFDGFPEYLIWNPSLSVSGAAFAEDFATLGYTAVESNDLFIFGSPLDAGYSGVFVTLGIFSDNYVLQDSSAEVLALMAYADAGNPLYMEGGDTWAYDSQTTLHGYFGIDGFADGGADLTSVLGVNSLDGFGFTYNGGNSFIDHLAPIDQDGMVIHLNPADSVGCGVHYLSPSLNTIGNSFEYGGLVDSVGTRTELLEDYLELLSTPYTDIWPPSVGGVTQFTFTLDTEGPYTVEAAISDNVEMDFSILYYNVNGGAFSTASMSEEGDGIYSGNIPGQPVGSTVGYYVMAFDSEGNEGFSPEGAPEELYFFDVVSHLPPVYLTALSGLDGTVELNWAVPGTEAPPQAECADYTITSMPFNTTGTNLGMVDNFDVTFSDGEDVAYQLNVLQPTTYTISLCNGTDYDSKLEVFFEDCSTSTGYYNDDACGLQSELTDVQLETGTYYVVVDGFSGATGNYTLDIFEQTARRQPQALVANDLRYELNKLRASGFDVNPQLLSSSASRYDTRELRELTNYGIYRSETSPVLIEAGNQIDMIVTDTTFYSDHPVVNGTTYYYRVSAIYDDGEAASTQVEAIAENHEPMMPLNLSGTVNDETNTVTLDWDDNSDYDLAGYYVYRDGEIADEVTESTFNEVVVDGAYRYQVSSFDTGGMESDVSSHIQVLVGEVPPSNLSANGAFDDHIELRWRTPGNPGPPLQDCADELIPDLPFVSNGTNVGMGDDFDVSGSDNEDYAYQLYMPEAGTIDIDLCGPNVDYDCKVEIFNGDCITTTGYYDDDGPEDCPDNPDLINPSLIEGAFLEEGLYFVVVDGFSASQGNFDITITPSETVNRFVPESHRESLKKLVALGTMTQEEAQALLDTEEEVTEFTPHFVDTVYEQNNTREIEEVAHYTIYRDGSVVGTTTETTYDDPVPEDINYFYQVTATYDNSAESAPSNTVEARANMAPGPIANFGFEMNGLYNVTFNWIDPPVNMDWSPCIDIMGIMVKRNGQQIAFVDEMEQTFTDNNIPEGANIYEFIPFDEVPNYGEAVEVRVYGGQPPVAWDFEDGMIPLLWTQSNPIVEWMVGTAEEMSSGAWTVPDNGSLICAINDDAAPTTADGNNALITQALDFSFSENVELQFNSFFNRDYSTTATVEYRIGMNGEWQVAEAMTISEEWVPIAIDLSFLHGQSEVYLAFHHDDGGAWAYGWAIDDVMLEGFQVMMMGDMDGDGFLNILDITRLIEILIETGDLPSAQEVDVMDVNGDGSYNVLDVVLLIEYVMDQGTLAKDNPIVENVGVTIPPVTLNSTREWQSIPVTVDYLGMISGFQADLVFDPAVVELGEPVLSSENESVGVFSSLDGNTMRVLGIDLAGSQIDLSSGLLMSVPVQVIDENATGPLDFSVEDLIISGPGGVEIICECLVSIIDIGLPAPTEFSLVQNYPNPFNPTTNIRYDIAERTDARLVIYNMLGQEVRTLVNETQEVGRYEVMWNGLDNAGLPISTGVYIYHLQAGKYSKTYKMAYIK